MRNSILVYVGFTVVFFVGLVLYEMRLRRMNIIGLAHMLIDCGLSALIVVLAIFVLINNYPQSTSFFLALSFALFMLISRRTIGLASKIKASPKK